MEASEAQPQFDEWAIIELMGHQRMAGHVTQAPIGDMLRIDVYDGEDEILYTRLVNPKAILRSTPRRRRSRSPWPGSSRSRRFRAGTRRSSCRRQHPNLPGQSWPTMTAARTLRYLHRMLEAMPSPPPPNRPTH